MRTHLYIAKKIAFNLKKDIYIKGTPYGLKKISFYFFCLIILLFIAFFVDKFLVTLIFSTIFASIIYFYWVAYNNGIFITLHSFKLHSYTNYVSDLLRLDKLSESARIVFFKTKEGIYISNARLSLFPYINKSLYINDFNTICDNVVQNAKVLILGGGADTLSCVAATKKNIKSIDSVELSKEMSAVGKKFFLPLLKTKDHQKIHQIVANAESYIKHTNKKYEFITIDIFVDGMLPAFVLKRSFILSLKNRLSKNGIVFINFSDNKNNAVIFKKLASKIFDNFYIYYFDSYYVKFFVGITQEVQLGQYYKKIS